MKIGFKQLGFALAFSVLSSATSWADSLPEGSFKGKSSLIKSTLLKNDVMALLLKKDPSAVDRYYAVLAEYDRVPLTNFTRRTALTKWIPRIYAYQVDKIHDLLYSMKLLEVTSSGDIVAKSGVKEDFLVLKNFESLNGATLIRYKKNAEKNVIEESIIFKGRVGSTWEDYIPGTYFGTDKKSGGDYFSKDINMELSEDGVATFSRKDVIGQFDVSEKLPGMFTFKERDLDGKGKEKVLGKIGVFIDIVNWKPVATTDELILINPEDASNVGFYYERH